jgi:hypothetical protein
MRTRWIAGIFAASAMALVTAASLAQRPERRPPAVAPAPKEAPGDRKPWRSKADPQVASTPPPTIESIPSNPDPSVAIEPGHASDDPMTAVDSFLRRNRKEADDSIQALTREAEALRARLAKVEAALARWQSVAGSLNPGQRWGQPDGPSEPSPDLSPIESAPRPAAQTKPPAEPPLSPSGPLDPPSGPQPGTVIPPPGGDAPLTLPNPSTPSPVTPAPPK